MIKITGNEFLINGLSLKYNNLLSSFENNNFENIIRSFKDCLLEVFPLREKYIKTTNKNNKFKALKHVYNLFKHKCDIDLLLKTHILICNKTYPYSFPFRYGLSSIKFGDFTEVFKTTTLDDEEKRKRANFCNKFLMNKELLPIMKELHNDTLIL